MLADVQTMPSHRWAAISDEGLYIGRVLSQTVFQKKIKFDFTFSRTINGSTALSEKSK